MDEFYSININKAIENVKEFYVRNNLGHVDENGVMNICISLDGAFSRRGYGSTYCVSVAIDIWTGRVVDFNFTIKCFKCEECNNYRTNGECEYGLFHGASESMELYNALVLFFRSEAKGLRYTTYVADGDSKTYNKLQELDPYHGIPIEKVECANHLSKHAYTALVTFGEKWTLQSGVNSAANRGKGRGKGKGRGGGEEEEQGWGSQLLLLCMDQWIGL